MGKRKTKYPGINRLADGRFVVRVQTKKHPRTGRRKEVKRIVECRTVQEALDTRRQLQEELFHVPNPEEQRQTVRAYARSWIESKALRVASSTAERYAYAFDLHILPGLGDFYLDALSRQDVETWVVAQAKIAMPGTVNGRLRILKTLMADACADLNLPNPCLRVQTLPEHKPDDDPNALTEPELRALLRAFQKHYPQHYPLILTLALTGLRWGEATALKWTDMDKEAGIIRVRRAHWRNQVKSVKTNRPRTAPLPEALCEVLDEWRADMVAKQHPGLEDGWCFPSTNGKLRTSNMMTKPMRESLKKAKIGKRVTVQGLRRSAEDVLRRLNVSGPVAEALMGHNARMRSRYSTVADIEVAQVGSRIAEVIGLETRQGSSSGSSSEGEKEKRLAAGQLN